jgi:hypothetical protein
MPIILGFRRAVLPIMKGDGFGDIRPKNDYVPRFPVIGSDGLPSLLRSTRSLSPDIT